MWRSKYIDKAMHITYTSAKIMAMTEVALLSRVVNQIKRLRHSNQAVVSK